MPLGFSVWFPIPNCTKNTQFTSRGQPESHQTATPFGRSSLTQTGFQLLNQKRVSLAKTTLFWHSLSIKTTSDFPFAASILTCLPSVSETGHPRNSPAFQLIKKQFTLGFDWLFRRWHEGGLTFFFFSFKRYMLRIKHQIDLEKTLRGNQCLRYCILTCYTERKTQFGHAKNFLCARVWHTWSSMVLTPSGPSASMAWLIRSVLPQFNIRKPRSCWNFSVAALASSLRKELKQHSGL